MPRANRLRTHRSAYTWILGLAILTITIFAVQRTFLLQDEQTRVSLERSRAELQRQVRSWKDLTEDRIRGWLQDLPSRGNPGEGESILRSEVPWFEAIYIWENSEEGPVFTHPPPLTNDNPGAELQAPCLKESYSQVNEGEIDQATLTYGSCMEGSAQEHLVMSSLLAGTWLFQGQPSRAWSILEDSRPALDLPLIQAPSMGVSARRMVTRRRYAAEALEGLGRKDEGYQVRAGIIEEITTLNGPQLEQLLPLARSFRETDFSDRPGRGQLVALDRALKRARLRLEGYQQLSEYLASRLSSRTDSGAEDEPRIQVVQDLYSENDYLFFVQAIDGGFAAVQVQSQGLLDSLMESLPKSPGQPNPVLINAEGTVLRGELGVEANAQVPLGTLFPRLYLAREIPPDASSSELGWLAGQLAPVAVAVLLGVIAITGRLRADTKERDLYERQHAFIARVTHELKTPLAGIRVMAETLEMGATRDEDTAKMFLGKIIEEAERLGKRIDEVLTVARKPEVSSRTPVHPHELAEEVVEHWQPRYQAVGARLEQDLKPCVPIAADPALLRDALNNLLDNALKYRRVGITGRCMVRTGEVGNFVIFEVTDNGIGVPQNMRRRIFERFARVESPGRGKAGGHGLGLSFAAEAVEAHGGLIECLDGFNGGTRIRMKLRRG